MADEGSVRVLERAGMVLDCFTPAQPRLQIADIRRKTGLPATTVERIVRTLLAQSLLEREGDEYRLGLRVLVWQAPAAAGSDLIAAAGPIVEQVRDHTGESTGVYVRQGAQRVGVVVATSTHSIIYRGYVGQVMPLHAGSAGKVFMAFDAAALDAAVRAGLPAITSATTTDRAALDDELAGVRERGWAHTSGDREVGLSSIAAPVFGADGSVVAALAVGAPTFRLTYEVAVEYGPLVVTAAMSLSQRLGYVAHLTAAADATPRAGDVDGRAEAETR
jgi:IclR family transcriptional regulator, acetate operon repressor